MTFSISKKELDKVFIFQEEQDRKVAGDAMIPYYGSIGGGYTYSFTPTSLGIVIRITNNITKEFLDVTSYEDW